jgi:hypothetical protein
MRFNSVLKPGYFALVYIGGLGTEKIDLGVRGTPFLVNFEKAYSEPVPINDLKVRDIRRSVSCILEKSYNAFLEM